MLGHVVIDSRKQASENIGGCSLIRNSSKIYGQQRHRNSGHIIIFSKSCMLYACVSCGAYVAAE